MKLEVDLSSSVEEQLTEVALKVWRKTYNDILQKQIYPTWMNLETTCKYLGISRSTLTKFIEDEGMPISVVNGVKRCNRHQVDEWMNQFNIN